MIPHISSFFAVLEQKPTFEIVFYLGLLFINIGITLLIGYAGMFSMLGASLVVIALLNHPDWGEEHE